MTKNLHETKIEMVIKAFERCLVNVNLSNNTILTYLAAVRQFYKHYNDLNGATVREYKLFLIENYKPRTVNVRIRAINSLLEYLDMSDIRTSAIKIQQKSYLEDVISEEDYAFFKNCLKKEKNLFWYFVIRFMASTGVRVGELVKIKVEHLRAGHFDLYSKGGKSRRVFIPEKLQSEALVWIDDRNVKGGFVFLNKRGKLMTARGISGQLKKLAVKHGIDPAVVYPHSFRHRFAKSFLERYNDISLLADLLGHESIETTRIYLRKTSTEQQRIINRVVDW